MFHDAFLKVRSKLCSKYVCVYFLVCDKSLKAKMWVELDFSKVQAFLYKKIDFV